jgi:6-phosphofructokinase 1
MGRHAGFIAAHATLANRNVDLCLIPEVPLKLDGPKGVLRHVEQTIEQNGYCTIVLAEGAGGNLIEEAEQKQEFDKSGNKKLPEIGKFLKNALKSHFDSTVRFYPASHSA